jgi:hypothetical protein
MVLGVDGRLGSVGFVVGVGLLGFASSGCSSPSEGDDASCNWERQSVEREERTAVYGKSVAELGEQFHIGEPWSCRVSWTAMGAQREAEWRPAGEDVEASLSFEWGDRAEEVTGLATGGTRLACPARLDVGLSISFQSSDGSLAEEWDAVGTYLGGDELGVELRPHEFGGYQGNYSMQWRSEWPETGSVVSIVLRPDAAVGDIVEWARTRSSADSSDGVQVSPATWACER